jgi:asparagine synthase (glutamine-hydrolysing)
VSGISGMWNLDGRPVDEVLLGRMSAMLAHRGADGEETWRDGEAGLGCQLSRVGPGSETERQPLVGQSGAVLVFDGRLDNRDELAAALGLDHKVWAGRSDAELVSAGYDRYRIELPERLLGDFAFAVFDPARQRLLLARDVLGVRPLYYFRTSRTFAFASEIKALLVHPQLTARPNDEMLRAYLLHRRAPGLDETYFEGVRALPAAHSAVVTSATIVSRRYWQFPGGPPIRLQAFDDYAAEFRHRFEVAVQRRLRGTHRVAISVSGGLDSSSIFCLAETLRQADGSGSLPVVGISYGSSDGSLADEDVFLQEIERSYGVAIERVVPEADGHMPFASEQVRLLETPMLSPLWGRTRALTSFAGRSGSQALMWGEGGDELLWNRGYLIDLLEHLRWKTLWAHLQEFGLWNTEADAAGIKRVLLREMVEHYREQAPALLVPAARQLRRHLSGAARPPSWYTAAFCQRGHQTQPTRESRRRLPSVHSESLTRTLVCRPQEELMEWFNKMGAAASLDSCHPFLDRDLISFVMRIPGETCSRNGVPRALLRRAMRGVLPNAIVERRGKGDYTHLSRESMQVHGAEALRRVREGGMAVGLGYVRGDMVRDGNFPAKGSGSLNPVSGVSAYDAQGLADLLGLELWLEEFVA